MANFEEEKILEKVFTNELSFLQDLPLTKSHFLVVIMFLSINSLHFTPVTQSCPTLCDPMNHSTPGLPVYHQPLESTQTQVH